MMSLSHKRVRRPLVILAGSALVLTMMSAARANLPGSSFEGNDGNLVVNTAGNKDWANVSPLTVGLDKFSDKTDNAFGQGTKEDDPTVSIVNGSIPPNKNDLTRFYVASEFASNNNYLYLAWERLVNIGNANMDLEINQNPTTGFTDSTTGTITLNRTAGDLLVTYDFAGSGTPTLGLLTWVTSGSTSQCFATNALPCWGNRVDLTGLSEAEGAVNTTSVTDPIAPNAPRTLTTGLFGEAAINLTAAGVFPPGTCRAFGSAFLKSRSSSSFPAEVKDFVAPRPVNISNCGKIIIRKVTENGDATFGYSTTGGLSPASFNLSNGQSRTYSDATQVQPGSYSVTESTIPAGWTLKSLVCTNSGGATSSPSGPTVNITMVPDGVVDCTYTNHINLHPSIATTLSATTIEVGGTVHDSATLTGASANAGGTVTYTVYTDSACSQGAQSAGIKTVTNGVVPDSNAITFNQTGDFYWQAVYSGDANNDSATSVCTSEHLVVTKKSPSIATTLSATTIEVGGTVHDSATLTGATGNAGGTVTYTVYTNNTCTANPQDGGTVNVTNGIVPDSNPITFNTAGDYYWQAVYSGDANNNGATSVCTSEHLVVTKKQPAMVTAPNLIPNDDATISGAFNATGTVTFNLFSPADSTCAGAPALTQTVTVNGNGTYSTTNTSFVASTLGTWRWQVSYSGDANNQPTTSTCGVERFTIANS